MHALSCTKVPVTRQQLGNLYSMMYLQEVLNTKCGWRAEEGKCNPTGPLARACGSLRAQILE